jgi:hypothetical protein
MDDQFHIQAQDILDMNKTIFQFHIKIPKSSQKDSFREILIK